MELNLDKYIYITSPELFPHVPIDEELRETHRIGVFIDKINIDDFEYKGNEKQTKEVYLKHLVLKGVEKKYDQLSLVTERLNTELELIYKNNWTDYFLACHKVVKNAKRLANAFIYQFSFSSGTNSLICYCLDFHHCDPIKYHLCYERFLYSDNLSLIINMDRQGFERFSKILRNSLVEFREKGEKIVDPNRPRPFVKTYYKFREWESAEHISLFHSNRATKIYDLCIEVEKQYGEVINPRSISTDNQKTLELFQKGNVEGVYDEWEVEKIKSILIDYQSSSFSDLVAITSLWRSGVDERRKKIINHKKSDNKRMHPIIKDLFVNPSDLDAAIPIQNAENSHLFECDDVLFETHGVILYQEQMMKLAQLIGDFTPEESNNLRKAFGKKQDINKYQKEFMKRGKEKRNAIKGLKSIWKEWEENIAYYYPKGSAVTSTLNLFQIAYFKAHYPKAFDEINKKIW